MPGAGRKTSAVVLGEAYGIAEGIAVDTHCGRLSMRLGLTDTTDPIKAERQLMAVVARKHWINWTHLMIAHGRAICRSRVPQCSACLLLDICPEGQCAAGGGAARGARQASAERAHHVASGRRHAGAMDRLDMELYADRLARDAQRVADELAAARLRLAWAEFEVAARDWLGGDDSRMLEAIGVLRDRHRRRRGAGRPAPAAAGDRPLPGVRRGAAGGAAGAR